MYIRKLHKYAKNMQINLKLQIDVKNVDLVLNNVKKFANYLYISKKNRNFAV